MPSTVLKLEIMLRLGRIAQSTPCQVDGTSGKVTIEENVCIGSHSVIMPGVTIGKNSVIGAFSFVNKDIPKNVVAFGVPARVCHKVGVRSSKE